MFQSVWAQIFLGFMLSVSCVRSFRINQMKENILLLAVSTTQHENGMESLSTTCA